MFKKLLSHVGIGAPHIEVVLHDSEVIRGEVLHGNIRIAGGRSAQEIHRIDIALQTHYFNPPLTSGFKPDEAHDHTHTLRQYRVSDHARLAAGETLNLAFDLFIPMGTPVSLDLSQTWLKSKLDVSWAVHDRDYDPIRIMPEPATRHLLDTALALGFVHTSQSGICLGMNQEGDIPFTQVFCLVPKGKITCRLAKQVQTLDLLVRANNYDAEIQLELNRLNQPLSNWLPEGVQQADRRLRFRLRHNQPFPEGGLEELVARVLK